MTDLKYRIIARDKDENVLGIMDEDVTSKYIFATYPTVANLTIERLPPEEAEPRVVWVNQYARGLAVECYPTKEEANDHSSGMRTACVQFIEAKITADAVERAWLTLTRLGVRNVSTSDVRAALVAALGTES